MQSYYGGWAECRIRKTKMLVDFTSQYPTCNSLLGVWDFMIAECVVVGAATKFRRGISQADRYGGEARRHLRLNPSPLRPPRKDLPAS